MSRMSWASSAGPMPSGAGSDRSRSNAISVRVELQADCFAGVWAYHADRTKHIIEQGDVEAALNAASAVGDDRLQRQARGTVVPDAFTHGSSAQRVRWFKRGLDSGSLNAMRYVLRRATLAGRQPCRTRSASLSGRDQAGDKAQ